MKVNIWTDENLARLREMWASGKTAQVIAKELKTSKNAVCGKVSRLGLPPHRERGAGSVTWYKTQKRKSTARKARVIKTSLTAGRGFAVDGKIKALAGLKARDCRWPLGDPRDDDFGFCGAAAVKRGSYCVDHHGIAYRGN